MMINRSRWLSRWTTVLLVLAGFTAGFAAGQQTRPLAAQDATIEPTLEAEAQPEATLAAGESAPETALVIPEADHEVLYPIWQTFDLIRRGYRAPDGQGIAASRIIEGALRGMVGALGDPNSYYISPSEREAFDRRVSAQTVGLGITVGTNEQTGAVYVTGVIDLSPAAEAGLLAGDVIVGIDGEDASAMTQAEIVERARGQEGEDITITVEREGVRIDYNIVRSVITRPVVSSQIIDGIGYIRLDQFSTNARPELDAALATITEAGATGLVIDLRNNAGGTSGATVAVASAFIPEGRIFTEDFGRQERVFEVNGDLANVELPLVVLVNERTQSAAEAFAGAIQDYELGTIVGVPTFGKGTVQRVADLSNGGAFRFTIARVLTPSGDTYHAVGIQPDILVEAAAGPSDEQLDAALDFLRGHGSVTGIGE